MRSPGLICNVGTIAVFMLRTQGCCRQRNICRNGAHKAFHDYSLLFPQGGALDVWKLDNSARGAKRFRPIQSVTVDKKDAITCMATVGRHPYILLGCKSGAIRVADLSAAPGATGAEAKRFASMKLMPYRGELPNPCFCHCTSPVSQSFAPHMPNVSPTYTDLPAASAVRHQPRDPPPRSHASLSALATC